MIVAPVNYAIDLIEASISEGVTCLGVSPAQITTSPKQWEFSVVAPLSIARIGEPANSHTSRDSVRIRLSVHVRSGCIGVGVRARVGGRYYDEVRIPAGDDFEDYEIYVPVEQGGADFVIRNAWSGGASEGACRIVDVEFGAPDGKQPPRVYTFDPAFALKGGTWTDIDCNDLGLLSYGERAATISKSEGLSLLDTGSERDHAVTQFFSLPRDVRFWRLEVDCVWPETDLPRCPVTIQDSGYQWIYDGGERRGFDRVLSTVARVCFGPQKAGTFALPNAIAVRALPDADFGAAVRPLLARAEAAQSQTPSWLEFVAHLRNELYGDFVGAYPDFHFYHLCERGMHRGIDWFTRAYTLMKDGLGGALCSGAAQLFSDLLWSVGIPAYVLGFGRHPASHATTLVFCPRHTGELVPVFHDAYFNYHLEDGGADDPWKRANFLGVLEALANGRASDVLAVSGHTAHSAWLKSSGPPLNRPERVKIDNRLAQFALGNDAVPFKAMLREATGREDLIYLCTVPQSDKPTFDPDAVRDRVLACHADAQARIRRLAELGHPRLHSSGLIGGRAA